MLAFNRKTRKTGWNFNALIVLNRGKVVYKLWSGEPNLERYETKKKPLGPLQELDGVMRPPSPYCNGGDSTFAMTWHHSRICSGSRPTLLHHSR